MRNRRQSPATRNTDARAITGLRVSRCGLAMRFLTLHIQLMYGIELILRYLVFLVVRGYVGDGNACA